MRFTYLLLLLFACTLTPLSAQLVGTTENGSAGYYPREYDGAKTAYNVTYNRDELVGAHRRFPLGSIVEVRNLDNSKTVRIRIIDKGPYIRGRVVEVSERAAALLEMIGKETVPVEITLVSLPGEETTAAAVPTTANRVVTPPVVIDPTPTPAPTTRTAPAAAQNDNTTVATRTAVSEDRDRTPAVRPAPTRRQQTTAPAPTVRSSTSARTATKAAPVSEPAGATATSFDNGTYAVNVSRVPAGQFGVQVGSYNNLTSAMEKVVEMQGRFFSNVMIMKENDSYKVVLGQFASDKLAVRYRDNLKERYKIDGFTVELK